MRHERDRRLRNRPDRQSKLRRKRGKRYPTLHAGSQSQRAPGERSRGNQPAGGSHRSRWWAALLCLLVVSAAYALQFDVYLRLGQGEVHGWVAPYRQTSWKGRHRAVDPPMVVVHPVPSGQPRYFHTFTPGVFNRIKNAHSDQLAAQRTGPLPGVPTLPVSREEMRRLPQRKHPLFGRIRYAGIGRKSVYAFEELADAPVSD